jgi:hypothetical protein
VAVGSWSLKCRIGKLKHGNGKTRGIAKEDILLKKEAKEENLQETRQTMFA